MDASQTKLAERFQCNYTVFEKGTDPKLVEQAYLAALDAGKEKGFWPAVLSLDEYVMEWLTEVVGKEYIPGEIIAGCGDNGKELLTEWYQEGVEYYEDGGLEEFLGNETEGEVIRHFSSYCSFQDRMLEADTLLLELPVKHPWEIIGYLPLGGWNECPGPEDMISVCKYWYETYRAIPAVFTHDVMEFYAPMGLNGADPMEVAKEHYGFCNDRVDQGTETFKLSELAAGLPDSSVWYFWWD